jgi:hypothetical protein
MSGAGAQESPCLWHVRLVPDMTMTYTDVASEDECKWFIAMLFILLKQITDNKYDKDFYMHDGSIIFTHVDKDH